MTRDADYDCAACGARIASGDVQNVGVYVANDGAMSPHRLCGLCMKRALSSKAGQAEIAELVELRFTPSRGAA